MEIVDRLKNEFFVTSYVDELQNGKICVCLDSPWKGRTPGVQMVHVYLAGTDALTGDTIPEDRISCNFSAISSSYRSPAVEYSGGFYLHCDAILETGDIVHDFLEPSTINLACGSNSPFIRYSLLPASGGWTGVRFESNCWKRCRGVLWVKIAGRYQLLPAFSGTEMTCFFSGSQRDLEIISSDKTLPSPQRAK